LVQWDGRDDELVREELMLKGRLILGTEWGEIWGMFLFVIIRTVDSTVHGEYTSYLEASKRSCLMTFSIKLMSIC
jgi:hypothetical protein